MKTLNDLDLLHKATADGLAVYDAIKRGQTLNAEGKQLLALAEDLLQKAGLAYLVEDISTDLTHQTANSHPEGIVSAYVQIQQTYVDLKDALYRLAKTKIDKKLWEEAQNTFIALLKVDPDYRDASSMLKKSFLQQVDDLFSQGKGNEGRDILKNELSKYPKDADLKLRYLHSFIDEESISALRLLQAEQPRVVKLPAFDLMINHLNTRETISARLNQHYQNQPQQPSYPSSYLWNTTEYEQKKRVYDMQLEQYNRNLEQHNQVGQNFRNQLNSKQDSIYQASEQLKAEIASLVRGSPEKEK